MGLDATAPLGEARCEYERVWYETVDVSQYGVKGEM